ncbi:MAG TPA: histidinol dehydrogenase [Gaiellaceae bacterium]|nr:histidinol dehydrogenase [Gaiellaceae bacterium]
MRRSLGFEDIWPRVTEIVADVRDRGDAAVAEWAARLSDPQPRRVPVEPQELEPDVDRALRSLIDAVTAVHSAGRPADVTVEPRAGVAVERRWLPLDSVGVYVPGGRFPLPSSLIMAAAPARAAGVKRICVVTPQPVAATIAVAGLLDVDELYCIGGVQAIAALAFGTETIAPVDKIVGPGNRFVTAAKLLVSAHVGVDLPAGPSEVVVIADGSASPALCLADLRAQAEHGPDSEAVLVTTSAALAGAVGWERTEIVESLEAAVAWSNEFAPEHLELQVADPAALAPLVRNAGAVFLGGETSAVIGDYYAGSNHVLPTGGLARSLGGLGLETFLKPVEFVRVTLEAARVAAKVAGPLARVEGLTAHGEALAAR